jgi:mRNA interferase MazF
VGEREVVRRGQGQERDIGSRRRPHAATVAEPRLVVVERGQIWWTDLDAPEGLAPGFRRPVLVAQSDAFNRSRIRTVIAVALTSNLCLVEVPGSVLVPAKASGLPKDSVANVSQVVTLDKDYLSEPAGRLRGALLADVDAGLRLVLGL